MKPQPGVGTKPKENAQNRFAGAKRFFSIKMLIRLQDDGACLHQQISGYGPTKPVQERSVNELLMDKLYQCATAYQKLLDVTYKIILGRKGKMTKLLLYFEPIHFHHLIGLHKLSDLRIAKANRTEVFQNILDHHLTYDCISKSRYFHIISKRFTPFSNFESILDQNNLIFRYNNKLNQFSLIQADFLLSASYDENEIYIFLAEVKDADTYFCRSFFPKEQLDYTKGQALYTILYKEKTYRSTGETIIQYNRLTQKK